MARALVDMLEPCRNYFVNEKSGFDFGSFSALYGPQATALEGWSRMFWGIGPFLAGGFEWEYMDEFLEGLKTGPDRDGGYYWGEPTDFDQRFVEMASLSLSFMLCREKTWDILTKKQQDNLYYWLNCINTHVFSENNWLFFRVLVNLAFDYLGLPYDEKMIDHDMDIIESFYEKDGWYRDRVPFDMYNPWAIQYYGLIYYKYRKDKDPVRCNKIAERSKLFAEQYVTYFNEEGASVPYGRSLTYRFAASSYFAAAAFAGLEVLPWGKMKGIVLRNFRYWLSKPIFDNGGILSVGWNYSNLICSDQYNAPGSPYWAFKIFIVLALDDSHPFWASEELPLDNPDHKYLACPSCIMMHTEDDDVIYLNNGQNPSFRMSHATDKYSKFAYSIHRGFNVTMGGHEFQNIGADNMLMFTEKGEDYLRGKDATAETYGNEEQLKNIWYPYKDVKVTSWLIPIGDWHIRIHKIDSSRELDAVECGFPLNRFVKYEHEVDEKIVGTVSISFPWGSSSIISLSDGREGILQYPMSNVNMMSPSVVVPGLKSKIEKGTNYIAAIIGESTNPEQIDCIPDVMIADDWKSVTVCGTRIELM